MTYYFCSACNLQSISLVFISLLQKSCKVGMRSGMCWLIQFSSVWMALKFKPGSSSACLFTVFFVLSQWDSYKKNQISIHFRTLALGRASRDTWKQSITLWVIFVNFMVSIWSKSLKPVVLIGYDLINLSPPPLFKICMSILPSSV